MTALGPAPACRRQLTPPGDCFRSLVLVRVGIQGTGTSWRRFWNRASTAAPRRKAPTGASASCSRRCFASSAAGRCGMGAAALVGAGGGGGFRHRGPRSPAAAASAQPAVARVRAPVAQGREPAGHGRRLLLCVTPTGWIMRLRGKDVLSLKRRPDLSSYWIAREPAPPDAEIDEEPVLNAEAVESRHVDSCRALGVHAGAQEILARADPAHAAWSSAA